AARYVRPGGRLVYATCSPLRAEDEDVVRAFLAAHGRWTVAPPSTTLPKPVAEAVTEDGFLRTWPDAHGTGAFFAALLIAPGKS
ncbi:MAG: RsmB/NOP family class I SAM-dependent RNA methyltransferase, partial [Myxococcales bacterium]